jgi:GntR family transcriptional regulator/MocR family aminotransferase
MYGMVIDEDRRESQYRQIYRQLRDLIISGELPAGRRLASSRNLAESLALSRSVVMEALDQLAVEGFVETRHGSGTFVTPDFHPVPGERIDPSPYDPVTPSPGPPRYSFVGGLPGPSLFPRRRWYQSYARAVESAADADLLYAPAAGRADLRRELSEYLYRVKGISCHPDSIVVTAGTAQALQLLGDVRRNGRIVMEDPVAPFVPDIFARAGYDLEHAPVDEEGLVPGEIGPRRSDYIFTAPSHQFPVGGTLGMSRRMQLIEAARARGAYIIEDDYDGEFRHAHRPVAALQVLAPERVVYIGTFSKIFSPAVRIAYMVVPPGLRNEVLAAKGRMEYLGEGLQQAAMAHFLADGDLEKHLRRSLRVYSRRRKILLSAIMDTFGGDAAILNHRTGLHFLLRFHRRTFPAELPLDPRELELDTVRYYRRDNRAFDDCLVIGFGLLDTHDIPDALSALKSAVY